MYKIGIDARLYGQTGVGVYLKNLLHYLEQISGQDFIFYIYLMKKDFAKIDFTNKTFKKRIADFRWHTFSEQLNFSKLLYQDSLDLMHFTYFSYPVIYKKKFISTIHDVTPLLFKTGKASTKNRVFFELKHRAFKFVIAQQVKNAQAIITPTKTVKKQLVDIYGKKYENKIHPIYEGIDYELQKLEAGSLKSERISSNIQHLTSKVPFFIYVGNFYPHKNVERLVKAYAKIKNDVKLILVGPDDYFSIRLLQLINILKQNNKITFYHNPSTSDLVYFYKNALALIHPSMSEGFGLPFIEAAYFKLPIIASNIEVFQELLNGRYISFNPLDERDIEQKINEFLEKRPKMTYEKISERFSFPKMTHDIYTMYQKVISE